MRQSELSLVEFIPAVNPRMTAPYHMKAFAELLEGADGGSVRAMCSMPIRHYKTETVKHAIAWLLLRNPELRIIFMTHSALYAQNRGREIRDLCMQLGVRVRDGHSTISEWRTDEGGGVRAMSAQQSALGGDVDILVVDDPFESQEAADSGDVRQIVDDTIAFYTARLSRGGSVFLVMSRFHNDDAIGRRQRRTAVKWEYIHHRAIIDEGLETEQALAPEVRTLEELHAIRAELKESDPTERTWWGQFQNEPRTDMGDLFKAPARYEQLPEWPGFRDFIGVDMAYSTGKRSDWFALVAVRAWRGQFFVREVQRLKADLGDLELTIRTAWERYGRCPVYSYMSGPEKGAAHYLNEKGIPIYVMPARYDKRTRAQKTINLWNVGKVMVPQHAPWVEGFLSRILAFRGVEGDDDDEVDALVSAHDGGVFSSVTAPQRLGKPLFG